MNRYNAINIDEDNHFKLDCFGDWVRFTDHEAAIKKAVEEEREACAKVAEIEAIKWHLHHHDKIPAIIRSRGKKNEKP